MRGRSLLWGIVIVTVSFVVAFAVSYLMNKNVKVVIEGNRLSAPIHKVVYEGGELPDLTVAAQKAVSAVVHVRIKSYQEQIYGDPWDFFWGRPRKIEIPIQTYGSGVIISSDGYIITNYHVVRSGGEIEVILDNKNIYKAEVVGVDPSTDLALLKIPAEGLPYLKWGNSDSVKVGEWVLAVGNPFNLTSTVTAGIISAKSRSIHLLDRERQSMKMPPIDAFLQTDAAVNPGNSGGALVNARGEIVGIVTAIQSPTGAYAGYSFAIPSNIARKVADDLYKYGAVQRAFLGVIIQDINSEIKEAKKLTTTEGVLVTGLTKGGGAEEAGIKEGDIIQSINDKPVNTVAELQEIIFQYYPGDKVRVGVLRGTTKMVFDVVLRNIDGGTGITKADRRAPSRDVLGAQLSPVSDEEKARLGIENGVKVEKIMPGSKLRELGIKEGYIITKINKKPVNSPEDVERAISSRKMLLIEGIYPDGSVAIYGFGI